jgi:hypothetical protein
VFGVPGAREEGYVLLCGALSDLPKVLREYPGELNLQYEQSSRAVAGYVD